MSVAWLAISIGGLVLGILAYGLAGAMLHDGSRAAKGALRSRVWWLGTALQGVGFVGTLLARRALPVVVVQASSSAGLAVTVLIQQFTGVQRLGRRAMAAIGMLLVGLGLIAWSIVPGPAVPIRTVHLWLLAGCAALTGALTIVPLPAWASGAVSGLGFSYAAIAARLLMGDTLPALWRLWQLPGSAWAAGLSMVTGILLGQYHLTRGLASGSAPAVLGAMYTVESILPATIGFCLLAETPRPGAFAELLSGVLLAVLGACLLASEQPDVPATEWSPRQEPTQDRAAARHEK